MYCDCAYKSYIWPTTPPWPDEWTVIFFLCEIFVNKIFSLNKILTFVIVSNMAKYIQYTLFRKKEVFGQLNPLEKCLKICYVYGKRKPTYVVYFIFHFGKLSYFPYEYPSLWHRPGHSREQWKFLEMKNKIFHKKANFQAFL